MGLKARAGKVGVVKCLAAAQNVNQPDVHRFSLRDPGGVGAGAFGMDGPVHTRDEFVCHGLP